VVFGQTGHSFNITASELSRPKIKDLYSQPNASLLYEESSRSPDSKSSTGSRTSSLQSLSPVTTLPASDEGYADPAVGKGKIPIPTAKSESVKQRELMLSSKRGCAEAENAVST
jgi:hypothetical protein